MYRRPCQLGTWVGNIMAAGSGYDAFISYSHRHDAALGPALKGELERFAKPWYQMRALRIFLDTADLAANPALWASIEDGLASSRWFILLASHVAAESVWANREVQWWRDHRSPDRVLVVGTSPGLAWDERAGDWVVDAPVPEALRGAFAAEPLWVDLSDVHADSGKPVIPADRVAAVAAPIRGVPKDTLTGEHLRLHRRAMRLAGSAVVVLAILTALAVAASFFAYGQRNVAIQQRNQAISREVLAQVPSLEGTEPGLARQLAVAAYQLDPTDQAVGTMRAGSSLPGMIAQPSLVSAVAYDQRRPVLAIATASSIALDNPATGAVLHTITAAADLLAFSPDGKLLAAADSAGMVQLWNVANPAHPVALGRTGANGNGAQAIAFAPDGATLGVSYADDTATLWNITKPAHPTVLSYISHASSIAFGPESMVAAGRSYQPGHGVAIALWRLTSDHLNPAGAMRIPAADQYQGVTALAFSPDGKSLVVGMIWGNANAPTGGGAVIADPADPAHPQPVRLQISEPPQQAAYSPDGRTLALRASDAVAGSGDIYLWDVAGPEPVAGTTIPGSSGTTAGMAFSPDSSVLDVGGGERVLLWRVTDPIVPAALATIPADVTTQPDPTVDAVAFSPQRHLLVTGSRDGLTHIWNVADPARPTLVSTIPAEPDSDGPVIFSVAISPDGRFVATGGDEVRLWNVSDPSRPARVWADPNADAYSLVFSPDGQLLASFTDGSPPLLWRVASSVTPVSLPLPHGITFAMPLAFAPAGQVLQGISVSHIWDWNVSRPAHPVVVPGSIAKIAGGGENQQDLDIAAEAESPDGRTLALALDDGSVQLWHLPASGGQPALAGAFPVSGATTMSLAFSPDGRTLATAGSTVDLWDVTDPADVIQLATFPGTLAVLARVAFSPDGRTVAVSSSFDGNAKNVVDLWDADAASLAPQLCRNAGTPVSRAQWRDYFGSVAYNPPCG